MASATPSPIGGRTAGAGFWQTRGMRRTITLLLQFVPAALLVWFGWTGIVAPASELPNSLFKVPLFFIGIAWSVFVVILLVRREA